MATRSEIAKLYVATFNRAADADGLAYWISDGTSATTSLTDLEDLAAAMTASAEYKALYDGKDREALVTAMYQNLFNRAPDNDGLEYWTGIDKDGDGVVYGDGAGKDVPVDKLIIALINGAKGDDATIMENKATVGLYYADKGLNDVETAKTVMNGVTADPTTVTAAEATVDEYVPQTLSLTTGADTLTGGKGDDTFNGVVSSLSSEATLGTKDTIDGGDGKDTLNLNLKGTWSGLSTDGSIKNVENINLTNNTVIDRSFDAKNVTGVEKYTLDSAKAISLSNLAAAGIEVEIKGAQDDSTIAFDSNLDLSGTDAMSLTLDGVGAAKVLNADGTVKTAENDVKVTMAKIDEVTLNTANNASFFDASAMDATTLTVKGDQALTVSAVKDGLTTFNASAATGAVTADLTGVTTANSIKTVNGGAGDDSITVDAADMVANASVAGGTGADVLTLKDSGTSTTQFAMSGVETLALSNATTTTFSAKNVSDLSTIKINTAATAATSLVNLGGADITINTIGATAAGADLTLDNSGIVTVNMQASSTNAAAKGTGAALANAETPAEDITASNASNLTINVEKGVNYAAAATVTASKATAVTLNVDTLLNKATTPTEQTGFSGKIVAAKATDLTIDAKGQVNLAGASDLTAVQTATIKAGDSVNVSTTDFESAASVALSGENKESAITTGKIGTDGTTAVDYDVNVTASGLKAGLTMDAIASQQNVKVDVNDTTGVVKANSIVGANVTLDASTLEGKLLGNTAATSLTVDSTTAKAGTATINAHDNADTVQIGTIGAIKAFKTVTVDVSSNAKAVTVGTITASDSATVKFTGNLDTSTVGAITAKDVTIDAKDALKAVTIGTDDAHNTTDDITITDSLTYTAGLVGADTTNGVEVAIAADTTNGTSTTVTLNGNIGDDKFFIDGGDNNTKNASITVKGDLDIGTNNVAVTSGITSTGKATIDLSGLTGSGTTTISVVGGTGDDTITAAKVATTITGAAGNDTITLGAGADTVITTVGTAYATGNIDTIKSFTDGASGDKITIDISDAEAVNSGNLVSGNATATTAGASSILEVALNTAGTDLGANTTLTNKTVIVLTGKVQDTDSDSDVDMTDLLNVVGDNGSSKLFTWGASNAADDGTIIVWSDGTDAHVSYVADAEAGSTDTTWETTDLSGQDIVTLAGVSSIAAGDFVAANFNFVA